MAYSSGVVTKFFAKVHPEVELFGTVTPGSRADLLLVSSNPLDDLKTLERPLGVMAAGRWYSAGDLKSMLDDVAKGYDQARVPATR